MKIFLVEDEFVVREGIKNNIDWEGAGYEFCGEASDGELAFPMIQKLKPDIVVTDIKMPFMDGLELSKLIKKECPQIEIIILSGYEEFEYAKEGIKIGVAEYLTKPISGEDLLKEINSVAARIEERQKEAQIRAMFEREMEENSRVDKTALFMHLAKGDLSVTELLEQAGTLDMDISALWYNVVLFSMISVNHEQKEYSGSVVEAEKALIDYALQNGILVFDRDLEGKAMLLKSDSYDELIDKQKKLIDVITDTAKSYEQIRYFGGIGTPVNRLRSIPESFESASHAYAHRYLVSDSRIMYGDDIRPAKEEKSEDFVISEVNPKQIDRNKIKEFIKIGDDDETSYFTDEFFNEIGDSALSSGIFRQYLAMDAYFCIAEFAEEMGKSRDVVESVDITAGMLKDVDSTKEYVKKLLHQAIGIRDSSANNRYGDVVDDVRKYIEENYSDEDLSLNTTASFVNLSPNHLSTVFSQQTGQTFIKYLTDYRMMKAKELLKCSGKRSSEISLEVGYKDPHYFSYLFKKTQGMTPTNYRGGKNGDSNETED